MTPQFKTVQRTDPALVVPQLLSACNLSMLPVLDETGRLVGVVSLGDFLRFCLPSYVKFMNTVLYLEEGSILGDIERVAHDATVADLMTRRVVTLNQEDSVHRAIAVLLSEQLDQVPVVEHGKLVGLLGRSDIVRLVARFGSDMTTTS